MLLDPGMTETSAMAQTFNDRVDRLRTEIQDMLGTADEYLAKAIEALDWAKSLRIEGNAQALGLAADGEALAMRMEAAELDLRRRAAELIQGIAQYSEEFMFANRTAVLLGELIAIAETRPGPIEDDTSPEVVDLRSRIAILSAEMARIQSLRPVE